MAAIDTIRLVGRFSLTYQGQTLHPDAGSTWLLRPYQDEADLETAVPPETKAIYEKRIWSDPQGRIVGSVTVVGNTITGYGDPWVDVENLHSGSIAPRIALGRASWKLVPESVTYTIPAALIGVAEDVTVNDAHQGGDLVLNPGTVNDLAIVRALNVGPGPAVLSGRGIADEGLTIVDGDLLVTLDDGSQVNAGPLPAIPGPPGPAGGTFIRLDADGQPYFDPVGVIEGFAVYADTDDVPYFQIGA